MAAYQGPFKFWSDAKQAMQSLSCDMGYAAIVRRADNQYQVVGGADIEEAQAWGAYDSNEILADLIDGTA